MAKIDKYVKIRAALRDFKETRAEIKRLDAGVKRQQPELIALMEKVDPKNEGIVLEADAKDGTAFVQQNDGSLVWSEEEIIDWLSHPSRKALRIKSSSRVFDINKWEALVASKEVPAKIAKKFQYTTDPPAPYIRFGKRKDESR